MTEPSKKSPGMEHFLDSLSENITGRKRSSSIQNDVCVICGQPATVFKDDISRKEFSISGMCQKCQDSVFN